MIFFFAFGETASAGKRKLVIITDLEPDDRVALHLLASRYSQDEVAFVGTTVMHAGRKAELTRRVLDQVGWVNVPVYQGAGGTATSYPDIASSRAAREYTHKGASIIEAKKLSAINASSHSSKDLAQQIKQVLQTTPDVEFVMLAPPTDLIKVLDANPALRRNIKHIHIMGGWIQAPAANGSTILRTTYNWNMDPIASAKLMAMDDIPMTLYSSHTFKSSFAGGGVNASNHPRVIRKIEELKARLPSLAEGGVATASWDNHVMEKIPPLRSVIGANAGKQFTPTDPAVVIGMNNDRFITESRKVSVSIDTHNLDAARGFKVTVRDNPHSHIRLVEKVDAKVFEEEILSSFRRLPRLVEARLQTAARSRCLTNALKDLPKGSR